MGRLIEFCTERIWYRLVFDRAKCKILSDQSP